MSRGGIGRRDPITKVRSTWVDRGLQEVAGLTVHVHTRDVHDGHLTALVDQIPDHGWHLSISHRTNHHPPRPGRYPTWDEIADARDRLLPADVGFVMHLPAADDYLAVHPTTFHLHQHPPEPA